MSESLNWSTCHHRNPRWNAEVPLPCRCCWIGVTALLSSGLQHPRALRHTRTSYELEFREHSPVRFVSLWSVIHVFYLVFKRKGNHSVVDGIGCLSQKLEYFWVGMFYAWSQLDVFRMSDLMPRCFQWIWIEWNESTKFFARRSTNSIVTRHHTDRYAMIFVTLYVVLPLLGKF